MSPPSPRSQSLASASPTDPRPRLEPAQRVRMGEILRQLGIACAAVFGSFARGDTRATSDVDAFIDPPPGTTVLDLARHESALSDAVGRPIQLVTIDELHPALRERVQREQ